MEDHHDKCGISKTLTWESGRSFVGRTNCCSFQEMEPSQALRFSFCHWQTGHSCCHLVVKSLFLHHCSLLGIMWAQMHAHSVPILRAPSSYLIPQTSLLPVPQPYLCQVLEHQPNHYPLCRSLLPGKVTSQVHGSKCCPLEGASFQTVFGATV